MYCHQCGAPLIEQAKFCTVCGTEIQVAPLAANQIVPQAAPHAAPQATARRPAAVPYPQTAMKTGGIGYSNRINDPAFARYIKQSNRFAAGLTKFLHKKSTTWDGKVVDKKVANKRRRERINSAAAAHDVAYTEYTVVIEDQRGKKHNLISENNSTSYDYFQVGDQVRHHAGLNTYEKYDKSRDRTIPCNACGTLNFVENENCSRCKCPLLSTGQSS